MNDLSDDEDQFGSVDNKHTDDMDVDETKTPRGKENILTLDEYMNTKSTNENESFYVKTLNVKDFINVITGCCSVPGADSIKITLDQAGMQLDCCNTGSTGAVVAAFFNPSYFLEFRVKTRHEFTVSKDRLEQLKKKISKEVAFLEIQLWLSENNSPMGLFFSGKREYKNGAKCSEFKFFISENTARVISWRTTPGMHYTTCIQIPSGSFKENINFLDDSNDFIAITLTADTLRFDGVQSCGIIGETIEQKLDNSCSITTPYQALFQKRVLKVITSTGDLSKTLNISVNTDSTEVVPVLFSYDLDQLNPKSHFSCYTMPITQD